MALANRAARISRSVNTALTKEQGRSCTVQDGSYHWIVLIIDLQGRCGQQDVGGLDHVCSMDVVVVGHVRMVMVLQSHHEGDKSIHWYLEGLQQLTLLR